VTVILGVYLSVCSLAGLHKKSEADLAEIFREGWTAQPRREKTIVLKQQHISKTIIKKTFIVLEFTLQSCSPGHESASDSTL